MTVWCMCIACWIPGAKNTHSSYNIALPPQQWLHEHTSMLHYPYIACLISLSMDTEILKFSDSEIYGINWSSDVRWSKQKLIF